MNAGTRAENFMVCGLPLGKMSHMVASCPCSGRNRRDGTFWQRGAALCVAGSRGCSERTGTAYLARDRTKACRGEREPWELESDKRRPCTIRLAQLQVFEIYIEGTTGWAMIVARKGSLLAVKSVTPRDGQFRRRAAVVRNMGRNRGMLEGQ